MTKLAQNEKIKQIYAKFLFCIAEINYKNIQKKWFICGWVLASKRMPLGPIARSQVKKKKYKNTEYTYTKTNKVAPRSSQTVWFRRSARLWQLNLWLNLWSRRSEKSTLIWVKRLIPCLLRVQQKLGSFRQRSLILFLKA